MKYLKCRKLATEMAPLTKELILEQVTAIPQHPAFNKGKQQYKIDIDACHATHGTEATPSLFQPYPIMLQTALPDSGKCFECRMVTEPQHMSGNCDTKTCLPTLKTRWWQIVLRLLHKVAQP